MSKQIIISLSVIAVIAAVAVGGTVAYFSDTETSTGNTFTAGAIDLKIDNKCSMNGAPSQDCTWELTDLDGELFFDFDDLKPGDWGEDTVSLHVNNNPAWGCVTFENLVDYDNGCTEPEAEDDDNSCDDPGPEDGELSEYLQFVFWADMCDDSQRDAVPGDNIFTPECGGDVPLMVGPASDVVPNETYVLAAPEYPNVFTGGYEEPLDGEQTYFIGKAWCFGVMDENELYYSGNIVCNGEEVDNIPQSDSLEGDIRFYVEQARNNDSFSCFQD